MKREKNIEKILLYSFYNNVFGQMLKTASAPSLERK